MSLFIDNFPQLNDGETFVLKKLRSLYEGMNYEAYLYVQPRLNHFNPDFILIDPYRGICVIEVKSWSFNNITIDRNEVVFQNGNCEKNPIAKTNDYFSALQVMVKSNAQLNTENIAITSRTVFDRVSADFINQEGLSEVLDLYPTKIICKDLLVDLKIEDLFEKESDYITKDKIKMIRYLIDPVVKLTKPDSPFTHTTDLMNPELDRDFNVLDLKQEDYAKRIPYGHYMISGVPGSGKTVILIARAIQLLKLNPSWNIKIVTYNKSLKCYIKEVIKHKKEDFNNIGLKIGNISVETFHQLALSISGGRVPQMATDEWWRMELPKMAIEKATPQFDAVLIDEYQDFYDDWLKLCLKVCKRHSYNDREPTENLFLAGDRLQSIYNPKEHTWDSLGINIKGNRSNFLKHSYRTAKYQFDRALKYLRSDPQLADEVNKFYEGGDNIDCEERNNQSFKIMNGSYQDVIKNIEEVLSNNIKPKDILIIVPTTETGYLFQSELPESIKKNTHVGKEVNKDKILITTYHSAKGLERKICFLIDSHTLKSFDSNELLVKKLLYVGMTRASEGLFLHNKDKKFCLAD